MQLYDDDDDGRLLLLVADLCTYSLACDTAVCMAVHSILS